MRKIKQYGSSTSRSFVPLSQSSICLADCICLTGVVVGLLEQFHLGDYCYLYVQLHKG